MENYFFLENYGTPEGAVSHNVLYYQPLPITRHQERFYANNYFQKWPIVSTAFKWWPDVFIYEKDELIIVFGYKALWFFGKVHKAIALWFFSKSSQGYLLPYVFFEKFTRL